MKGFKGLLALQAVWLLAGCGSPDSAYVCGENSKESVFARSLTDRQLESLYVDSMKIAADLERARARGIAAPEYTEIPPQFSYLHARQMRAYSGESGGGIDFALKGCMDEFIYLTVDHRQIELSYGLGGAANLASEVLWIANNETSLKSASSRAGGERPVAVSFQFPGKAPLVVQVTKSEAVALTGSKEPYAAEFWVLGALSKARLKHTIEHIEGDSELTAIGGIRNGSAGKWIHFIDDVRSDHPLNSRKAPDIRSIRFVFES